MAIERTLSIIKPDGLEKGIRVKTASYARHHINVTMARAKMSGTYPNSVLATLEEAGIEAIVNLDGLWGDELERNLVGIGDTLASGEDVDGDPISRLPARRLSVKPMHEHGVVEPGPLPRLVDEVADGPGDDVLVRLQIALVLLEAAAERARIVLRHRRLFGDDELLSHVGAAG